jgi:hypothetical protein
MSFVNDKIPENNTNVDIDKTMTSSINQDQVATYDKNNIAKQSEEVEKLPKT